MKKQKKKQEGQIFISYAREDSEDGFVKRLYDDLLAQGFNVWLDKERLLPNAEPWRLQIRHEVKASERIIAVIGPHALKSEHVWYEWEYGYRFSKDFIPILRAGEYKDTLEDCVKLNSAEFFEKHHSEFIPEYILKLHCADFRGDNYQKEFRTLCESLANDVPSLGTLTCVDGFPPRFIPRPKALQVLSDLVLEDLRKSKVLTLDDRVTAIHGRGGLGKSVLALEFARLVETRRIFKDGVMWIHVGEWSNEARRTEAVRLLGKSIEDKRIGNVLKLVGDAEDAQRKLRNVLEKKRRLLIVDDVWSAEDVDYFKAVLDDECRLVFTTRDADCIGEARCFSLGEFKEEQAKRLLADWSKVKIDDLPDEALAVAKECDMLPIAVAICGAIKSAGRHNWSQILENVRKAKTYLLKREFPHYSKMKRKPDDVEKLKAINIFSPLQVSLDYLKDLDEEEIQSEGFNRDRHGHYLEMSAFGSEVLTPESVVIGHWISKSQFDENDLVDVLGLLINRALVQSHDECESPVREVSLHNLQQVYLAHVLEGLGEKTVKELQQEIGAILLKWWQENKDRKLEQTQELQVRKYIMDHLFRHVVTGGDYKMLRELLTDTAYLARIQQEGLQYHFQSDFTSLLVRPDVDKDELEEVLADVHDALVGLPLSRKKADWLDTFAYWLTEFGAKKAPGDRASMLKSVSDEFDKTCAKVSRALAKKYRKEANRAAENKKKGKFDCCMRFAELYTWVCQRSGDFDECVNACKFAKDLCMEKGMPPAYRDLGKAEFIRMRAHAYKMLAEKQEKSKNLDLAREAYDELCREFSSDIWMPEIAEWETLEGDKEVVLRPPKPTGKKKQAVFKARVVSNTHDCIGAIHIIRFFMKNRGQVQWIHHNQFKPNQLVSDDVLFTVLLGGPKAPEISDVAYEFYKCPKNQEKYLRMYSGKYIEANRLYMKSENTHCYMLGGISKLNTLMAAYEFTEHALEEYTILKTMG